MRLRAGRSGATLNTDVTSEQTPPARSRTNGRLDAAAFWTLTVLLGALTLLWPGDAPFINDEAIVIGNALEANAAGRLARLGIMGTVGVQYGPIPTWFYQLLLLLSRNLVHFVVAKVLLSVTLTVAATVALADELEFRRGPLIAVFASPYLYFMHRILWDNILLIPASAYLFLCLLRIAKRDSMRPLIGAVAATVLLVHIQIKAVFVLAAFYATLLLCQRDWLRHRLRGAGATLLAGAALCGPYVYYALSRLSPSKALPAPPLRSVASALAGVRYVSFVGWPGYYLPEMGSTSFMLPRPLTQLLIALTGLVFFLFAAGVGLECRQLVARRRKKRRFTPRDNLTVFAFLTIGLSACFYAALRQKVHPHYFASTWFAYFYFAWCAVDRAGTHPAARLVLALQAGAQVLLLVLLVLFIHMNGGSRGPYYGATLSNQITVHRALLTLPPERKITMNVRNYQYFPHTYHTLQTLVARQFPEAGPNPDGPGHVTVDYLVSNDPNNGWITVRAGPPDDAAVQRASATTQPTNHAGETP